MYSRDFGGVRSDGQMRDFEEIWRRQQEPPPQPPPQPPQQPPPDQEAFNQRRSHQYTDYGGPRNAEERYAPYIPREEPPAEPTYIPPKEEPPAKKGLFNIDLGFLRNIQLDDLILIALAVLLLLDSNPDNDMLLIVIGMLLFF